MLFSAARRGRRGCDGRSRAIAAMVVAVALGLSAAVAAAQQTPDAGQSGFGLRKQPPPVLETVEDFERYRDHKAWEKAFAALAKVSDTGGDRLVLGPDGLAIPTATKIRGELLSLPPDGREAYRLFNDAKAQQLSATIRPLRRPMRSRCFSRSSIAISSPPSATKPPTVSAMRCSSRAISPVPKRAGG